MRAQPLIDYDGHRDLLPLVYIRIYNIAFSLRDLVARICDGK